MRNSFLIASISALSLPSCVSDDAEHATPDARVSIPSPVDAHGGDVPLSEEVDGLITPIEILTDCGIAPIDGGCSTPPVPVYGEPGPTAGYSHSTCTGPVNGKCWDKNVGGTIYKSTIEVNDWVPRFNAAFELPQLSDDGTMWNFPNVAMDAYLAAKLTIPSGCRLKWVNVQGWTWPNWMSLDYKVRGVFSGQVINGYRQQNYGGWGPILYSLASAHLSTQTGDDAYLEVGTMANGFSITRGDYFYNCPGF